MDHVSQLTGPYAWVGPHPHGWVATGDLPIVAQLLKILDRLLSQHPDAMLDVVEVATGGSGLRFHYRLSRSRSSGVALHAMVRAEVEAAENRSASMRSAP